MVLKTKKVSVLAAHGRLECEACGFDFEQVYGTLGATFAEAHHIVPIAKGEAIRTIDDLAIVCSNCHRMLHRSKEPIGIAELRRIITERATGRGT